MPYTVTIYVAAPGTPLLINGGASLPGHLFYTTNDGENKNSYGFAPVETAHGSMFAKGKIYSNDIDNYQKPVYARTIEVSKDQYEKIEAFGKAPEKFGFNKNYEGTWNNCVDFTWSALNHAGLHSKIVGFIDNKSYEGALKPTRNISDIKEITAPFPKSPLNTEVNNPWPKDRTFLQKLLSENDRTVSPSETAKAATQIAQALQVSQDVSITKNSSVDDMFERLYKAAINKDDDAARVIGREYAQSPEGQEFNALGRQINEQQRLQEQLQQQQQIALDNQQQAPRGPSIRM